MLENVGRECFVGKYDINANGFSVNTVYVSRLYESLRINFNWKKKPIYVKIYTQYWHLYTKRAFDTEIQFELIHQYFR